MTYLVETLSRLPFWSDLTEGEKELAVSGSTIKSYLKGSLVHDPRSECLGLTMLLEGEMRSCIISEEGREITLYRMYSGDMCTLSASCILSEITFDTHFYAQTNCTVLTLAPHVLNKIMGQNLKVRCFLFEFTASRFSEVMLTMQDILFKGYDRRLAKFLISEFERTGSPKINLTHEQIAQYTSSAREVVARTTKRFSDEGLIESSRGRILLVDIDGIRALV